jgi:hypothetical protein
MSENEVTRLEAALAALDPRPAAMDRDRLMFMAGQRSARLGWLLPRWSAALALAATLLAVLLLYRSETHFVYVPVPRPEQPAPQSFLADADVKPAPTGDYILLRNRILTAGVDALPPLPADPSSGPSPNGVLKPYLLPRDDWSIPGGPQ